MIDRSPLSLLVVEDDLAQAGPLVQLLRLRLPLGSGIVHVDRIARAVDELRATAYDVVLLDLGLPDSDGLETIGAVRAASKDVIVIVLTGREDDELVEAAVSAGADDYFVKGEITAATVMRAVTYAVERRRGARALRASEARFRELADSIPAIVWTADENGVPVYSNRRWYEKSGFPSVNDTPQGTWLELLHPDDVERREEAWNHSLATGEPYRIEYRIRDVRTGDYRWHLGRALAIRDARGSILRWYGTAIDIHDLKTTEQELVEAKQTLEDRVSERTRELAEANEELEAFSYSVSHDLRAPLRVITGFAHLLREQLGANFPPTAQKYADNIVNGTAQMERLIDDLLSFSKCGRDAMEMRELNMRELVETALQTLDDMRRDRNVEITIADLPACVGDDGLMQQVWVNLLSNALKYTRGRDPAVISIGTKGDAAEHVFFVKDNGIGFHPADAAHLFGAFRRLPGAENYEGTGIGLALVARIIRRHGGRVWAQGAPQQGSTIFFTLGDCSENGAVKNAAADQREFS